VTETVTVEVTREELSSISFALLKLELNAWKDLWLAQGLAELQAEDSNYAEDIQRSLPVLSKEPRQVAYLNRIIALRQKIRAVPRPAPEPAPKRQAKAGAG
jgi:hypothetical protein